MKFILTNKRNLIVAISIGLLALAVLLYHAGKPLWGNHDFNNAIYGNMARNIVRYGTFATKLGQPLNSGPVENGGFSFHTHHPPLLIYSLAISYSLFGISEFTTRLVPILFSAGTLIVLFFLLKKTFSPKLALTAAFLAVPTPIFLYYGKNAVQEILVVFFFVLSLLLYYLWLERKGQKLFILFLVSVFFGLLSGWAGYFSVVALLFLHILSSRKVDRTVIVLSLLALSTFALHLAHNKLLTGSPFGGGFGDVFTLRSSGVNMLDYAKREWAYFSVLFTRPLLIFSVIGFIFSLTSTRRPLIMSCFLFGVLYILLFKTGGIRHDYLIYPLLPFILTTASLAIFSVFKKSKYLSAAAASLLLVIIALTSFRYSQAIIDGDRYRESVAIGKYLHTHTKFNDKTLILISDHNIDFEPWLMVFYADRDLRALYKTAADKEVLTSYNYVLNFSPPDNFDMQRVQR